ncbi:hypothetical protein [Desulforhopalus singaporensis]|uniref:Uncharacterized protein n=1 Tax=Desulforhopalus singaporensis TaxID=91360 RepID=A0A1H0UVW3_9BACT|nr:hypothetical protein [Desulforhopalus singaporensis]SDP70271.1 hypothetical protein SAMN05660330_03754 [Desulforhopalus singaporensis]SDP70359.1 hypothetical protein SAMN05660330_03759 [Desulforhopalus singaporensis]
MKPLPQAAITADKLRRMAKELILQAEELEVASGVNEYQPTRHVEFEFSPKKLKERKVGAGRQQQKKTRKEKISKN